MKTITGMSNETRTQIVNMLIGMADDIQNSQVVIESCNQTRESKFESSGYKIVEEELTIKIIRVQEKA